MGAASKDTIFALATAPGIAGVSVVRISGPQALTSLYLLCGKKPHPRLASLFWVNNPNTGKRIDRALVLLFPGPASFTGEDVVELHLHGSPAVVRAVLRILGQVPKVRLAEPGEFTRRAVLNGKLDIVQAEGLGDLLAAETDAQLKLALDVMEGRLSRQALGWRDSLLQVLALIEVTIDFSDEELPEGVLDPAVDMIAGLAREMRGMVSGSSVAERLRSGFEVAIVGRPNAGKSTLLNWLAGREAALTSPHAGTTRDVLEVRLDLGGIPVTFLDMAGLRDSEDEIESLGIRRARERAERADIRLFLLADGESTDGIGVAVEAHDLVLHGKADVAASSGRGISGLTGAGVPEMLRELEAILGERVARASLLSHDRQRKAVEEALIWIDAAEVGLRSGGVDVELVSADIRSAVTALDYLVGKADIEAVFDIIFRNFCLGK
ncbi:tRNA uridine-5-carboxymethylaminomethyl(34) synthesis GTPase MnmE [Rhodobacteraceae bacterium DSL-40]|uniref:tRNA uridine-5-carboxymethylaminomethyl(34) synthesis GTPase MnmE n=1 Tax=Amaricoccus sp. B4 TaxID=3368557 RepID=UPI000DADBB75